MSNATATATAPKKLSLKEKYAQMTRGLGWETTYQPMDKVYPQTTSRASRSMTGTSGKTRSV